MNKGLLTYEDLPSIYEKLAEDLPVEGIEKAKKEKTRKGYDTTGYGYQYHVNRMNEVLFGHWKVTHKIFKETETQTSTGKPMYNLVIHMVIEIGNFHFVDGENKFETLATADGYGGHTSLEIESAHKGAYTNAFKKVSAMFGVGKKAFEGTLDDDIQGPGDDDNPGGGKKPSNNKGNHQPYYDHYTRSSNKQTTTTTPTENPVFQMETREQTPLTQGQSRKIYALGNKELKIPDEDFRNMMEKQLGVDSSKDITKAGAKHFIDYLENVKKIFELRTTLELTGGQLKEIMFAQTYKKSLAELNKEQMTKLVSFLTTLSVEKRVDEIETGEEQAIWDVSMAPDNWLSSIG